MAKTKVTFDKIIQNQNQLAETLTDHAKKMMNMFEVNPEVESFTKETTEAYLEQGKAYVEALSKVEKPEAAVETMTNAFTKFMELQTATYNKTADFYRNMMENYSWANSQEKFNEVAELYNGSFKAIVDTAGDNTKVLQELMQQPEN
jgi:cytochrome oxidase Cu insertion factor (SCO1/SenC/PrrC family)